MFPIPNTPPGPLVQDLQRLRRKYESSRLEHLKKVRESLSSAAKEETEYLKAVFSAPKKIDDQE
jgi:hypothetical protein